jgi:hypothetical protein
MNRTDGQRRQRQAATLGQQIGPQDSHTMAAEQSCDSPNKGNETGFE